MKKQKLSETKHFCVYEKDGLGLGLYLILQPNLLNSTDLSFLKNQN